jgi:hypothetical protein
VHWATLNKARQKQKEDARILAREAGYPDFPDGPIKIKIEWYPKTRHRFDEDNAIASLKGALDGIAKAWDVDDSRFTYEFHKMPPVKGGKVVVSA